MLTDYIFICGFVPGRETEKDGEVLFFILPSAPLFAPRRVCSIKCFLFFFPRHSEKIWFTFFPLSPSLWRYSYLNINSHTSSLAHTLSHIDICIWSLLLALHALLYCVSFNRCKIQYCNLCIQAPQKTNRLVWLTLLCKQIYCMELGSLHAFSLQTLILNGNEQKTPSSKKKHCIVLKLTAWKKDTFF